MRPAVVVGIDKEKGHNDAPDAIMKGAVTRAVRVKISLGTRPQNPAERLDWRR